jgi:hypothetical protein
MKLKIFLSVIFPPILFFLGLFSVSVILSLLGLNHIDDFRAELLISLSAYFITGAFVAVVLLPVFYYVLWTKGNVGKAKIKNWFFASSTAVLICIFGATLEYASSLILADAQFDQRVYSLIFVAICIIAPIISIKFSRKRYEANISTPAGQFIEKQNETPIKKRLVLAAKKCSFGLSFVSAINAFSLAMLQAWWMSVLSVFLGLILLN